MAIHGGASFGRLKRNPSTWLDVTADWTAAFWQACAGNTIIWLLGAEGYAVDNLGVYTDPSNQLILWTWKDPTGVNLYQETTPVVIGTGLHYLSVRYTAATTTLALFVDGTSVGTLTIDLSTWTIPTNESILNDGGLLTTNATTSYQRRWQAALTGVELAAELATVTAVRTADLLADARLVVTQDLTDTQGHPWMASGTISFVQGPTPMTVAVTAINVPNDRFVTAYTIDASDGTILTTDPLVLCEVGDRLPSGIIALARRNTSGFCLSLDLFSRTSAPVATLSPASLFPSMSAPELAALNDFSTVRSNGSDRFYMAGNTKSGSNPTPVRAVSDSGTLLGTWTLAHAVGGLGGTTYVSPMAASFDNATLYYGTRGLKSPIYGHDLLTDTDLGIIVPGGANGFDSLGVDMFVLASGQLLVAHTNNVWSLSSQWYASLHEADGTLVSTIPFGLTNAEDGVDARLAIDWRNPTIFWLRTFNTAETLSTFRQFRISDGALLSSFSVAVNFLDPAGLVPISCPFFAFQSATGTVIVIKQVDATVEPVTRPFHFTVGGGLSPATFSLMNGESRAFSNVTAGTRTGYSIEETAVPDFVTTYAVSNNSSYLDLTVPADGTVTVTVTNRDRREDAVIRRVRRSPHINDEKIRLIMDRFELDMQPGIGNVVPPGADPIVMCRQSFDGGNTWLPERQMHAGAMGQYLARTFLMQMGQSRDRVIEVSVTDPVTAWYLSAAYGTFRKGSS
jgi:hypothetical protein